MDSKTLQTLRIGDTVRIYLDHYGSRPDEPRSRPFDVVIAAFHGTGRVYKEEDGHYYESRLVKWYWANMPEDLQPWAGVRDDVRGFDACDDGFIIDIIKRAPYEMASPPRNALYHSEMTAFLDHKKVEDYRKAKGEDTNPFGRRERNTAVGYVFYVYNETYKRNIPVGQYNGHVFKLAEVLIARRPALAVPGRLDPDRFYAAWNQAGQPGRAGPFRRIKNALWVDSNDDDFGDSSPYKALINRKAFTRWVERNVQRFIMTKATILKNMIQAAIDEEEYMRKSMEEDYEREFGHRPNEPMTDDSEDDEINYHLDMQADEFIEY